MATVRHNQSGYIGSSRSRRAAQAERESKLPLNPLCQKYGYNRQKAKRILEPCEWHHTSKYANPTDYYDEARAYRFWRHITVRRPTGEQLAARVAIREAAIDDARSCAKCYLRESSRI